MKRARLRLEMTGNNFMLSKLIDIETGMSIPFCGISFSADIKDNLPYIEATIRVPIEEVVFDNFEAEVKEGE